MSSILIVGKPGSGKTRSLTTLPGSLFIAEFDPSGERSIRREPIYFEPGDAEKVSEAELTDTNVAIIRYLSIGKTVSKEFRMDNRQLNYKRMMDLFILDVNYLLAKSTIKNIVCDPLTGLVRVAKGACFAQAGPKGATFKDWDLFAEKVLEIVEVAQAFEDKNFIVTAHITTEKDAITEAIEEKVYTDGQKIPRTIIQAFDIVYQSVYRNGEYVWRTKPSDTFQSIRNRLIDGDDVEEYVPQDFTKLLATMPRKK